MRVWGWLLLGFGVVLVVLVGALWWASGGIPSREKHPAWLTGNLIAHRGLHTSGSSAPENSLASFEAAAEAGLPVELDVQLSADGAVVVLHDETLERMAGDPRLPGEVTMQDLGEMRLLGGEEPVPSLAEALEVIDGRVPVLVELKNGGDPGPLEDAVATMLTEYAGDSAVISFNPYSLGYIAEREPGLLRGQLASTFENVELAGWKKLLLRNLLMNWTSRPDFIAYEISGVPRTVTTLQQWRGRPLLGWTAENAADLEHGLETCDSVICNPGALEAATE
jgi:glycerophosphoryl diester phosphodiesterase